MAYLLAQSGPLLLAVIGMTLLAILFRRRRKGRQRRHGPGPMRPLDGLVRDRSPRKVTFAGASRAKVRGDKAEFMVATVLSRTCDDAMGDVYLPSRDGTTQIDHIARRDGLLVVVETKSLFGAVDATTVGSVWTHLTKGGKRDFQNPLHQNHGHVLAVKAIVGPDVKVEGIVAIVGRPTFHKGMPRGVVHIDDLERRIVMMSDQCRRGEEAADAMKAIRGAISSRPWDDARRNHARTVEAARERRVAGGR